MKGNLELKHDQGVLAIADRLKERKYDAVTIGLEYERGGNIGECDILTLRNEIFTYYEYKTHHSKHARHHALEQLHRWAKAYHDLNTRMVYVSRRKDGSIVAERVR